MANSSPPKRETISSAALYINASISPQLRLGISILLAALEGIDTLKTVLFRPDLYKTLKNLPYLCL
jgi:hypothetical protein